MCPGKGGVTPSVGMTSAASQLMDEEAVVREQGYGLANAHKASTSMMSKELKR